MPDLTRQQIEHVALLARLQLSDEELERLRYEMNRILEAFAKLQQLDTEGIEPTAHAISMSNVFREDKVQPTLPREEALHAAPDATSEQFRVPLIVEE